MWELRLLSDIYVSLRHISLGTGTVSHLPVNTASVSEPDPSATLHQHTGKRHP